MNQFILNADDFGMSEAFNDAVLEGFKIGLLKSTSLTANGVAFDDAISRIIPQAKNLSVGVHLNIIEGTALSNGLNLLCDNHNEFNNSYISLILKSYGTKRKEFLNQVEQEFRTQIEKVLNVYPDISHIDSHVHTHAIPPIFKLVCKLAQEYKIPFIRTQGEKPYIVPNWKMTVNKDFAINILKNILLNTFTFINKPVVEKHNLKTNDYQIGVLYTLMMSNKSLYYGLKSLKKKNNKLVESLIHPCLYANGKRDNHSVEFEITQDKELIEKIKDMGFVITDFKSVE